MRNDEQAERLTELEATIAGIWAEVLGIDRVGLNDNFLLLGGESLLATQVVSEIRARLGCEVSIRSIFVGTVAEVAAEVRAGGVPQPVCATRV
jgi:acyl carrier protein